MLSVRRIFGVKFFFVGFSEFVFIMKGNYEILVIINVGDDWDWVGLFYFYWNGFYLDWVIYFVLLVVVF